PSRTAHACLTRLLPVISHCCFAFTDTVPTVTYTLSLHDALPISSGQAHADAQLDGAVYDLYAAEDIQHPDGVTGTVDSSKITYRSEEHTSEHQSRFDLVCRLLLEKKKKALIL